MTDLTKDQCMKLKEWGLKQEFDGFGIYYDVNCESPRYSLRSIAAEAEEWEIKIPTVTELKEFALQLVKDSNFIDDFDIRTVAIWTTYKDEKVSVGVSDEEELYYWDIDGDVLCYTTQTESASLYFLIERIVEVRDD